MAIFMLMLCMVPFQIKLINNNNKKKYIKFNV